jgi:hypothetical protein
MKVGSKVTQVKHHHGPPWVVLEVTPTLVHVARRLEDGTVDVAAFGHSTIAERPMKCGTCSRPLHCRECGGEQ